MPLELFYGTAVCLDVTEFKPQTDITAEDLDRVESESAVDVQPGDIVLFHTATWNRYAGDKRYLSEFPGLGESASEWIVRRRIKTFGVDSPTPDNPASTSYPVPHDVPPRTHHPLRNLANLDRVVNTRFTFVGLPAQAAGRPRRPHAGGRAGRLIETFQLLLAAEEETVVRTVTDTVLPTTMIGSYPKPRWYSQYNLAGADLLEWWKLEENWHAWWDATTACIKDQELAGLDIVTDGQMHFDDYGGGIGSFVWYWYERLGGFTKAKLPNPLATRDRGERGRRPEPGGLDAQLGRHSRHG